MLATSKGSDQSAHLRRLNAQADLSLCWLHIPHCWKSHVMAQLYHVLLLSAILGIWHEVLVRSVIRLL